MGQFAYKYSSTNPFHLLLIFCCVLPNQAVVTANEIAVQKLLASRFNPSLVQSSLSLSLSLSAKADPNWPPVLFMTIITSKCIAVRMAAEFVQ